MTEDKDTNTYEIVCSFIQPERALVRISATSEEMARAGLREMTEGVVRDLQIESIREVSEDTPVPEGYDPADPQTPEDNQNEVIPLKKTVH